MKKLAIMLALSLTLQSVIPLSVTAAEISEENMTQSLSKAENETVLEERSEKELTEKETFSDNEGEIKEELTAEEEETIETAFSHQEYTTEEMTEEQLSIEEKTEEQLSTEEVTEEQRFTEEESAEDTWTEKNQDASESNLQVAYHTQNEIMEFLAKSNAVKSDGITYDTEPRVSAPYSVGALSSSTLESATAMVNQVRYIAGLPYDVMLNDEYNKMCQAAALVNYVNGELSHTPSKPSDMESNLYNLGYTGASESNMAWASRKTCPLNETIVDSWMADDDSSNIPRVGHRRWVLNPSMGKIGFGAVNGSKGIYSAMYAIDSSGSGNSFGVAWPAQNMPIDYFNNAYPWSVSTGETVEASKIKVKLTRKDDGKTWNFSQSSADGDFYIDNGNYGQTGCIIFRPDSSDIDSYKDGDTYLVEITQNDIPYINYQVNFFNAVKDDVEYTVTFDSNGGTSVAKQSIPENRYVTEPDKPTKEGYSFEGWFKEKTCQIAWDFSKDTVTKDMTLYAKWVENVKPVIKYTVTYDMQGHGEQVSSETVEEGTLITEPSVPSAKNYAFEGWYKDAGCQIKWDFESNRVSSNMTLYAKWIPDVSKDVIAEGKIDENYGNIVWSIDKNGKLLVTGRGDYYSVDNGDLTEPPWLEYKDKIKTAKISLSGSRSTYAMFQDCITLTEVDLSELNTDSVKNMDFMFDGCSSLTAADLGHFNTGNVNTMVAMFQGCSSLKTLDLSNFDTSSLVDMEAMFLGCNNLSKLDVSHLNTGNVRSMGSVFAYCSKLTNVDLRSFDTKNVTRMCSMFSGCNNLAALDLSHFNTDRVREMSYMFGECRSLKTLDISNFNTRNVKEEDGCNDLLSGCVSLSYIHAPKNCTYSVELPIDVSTDKWYLNENTECTELPKNLGHSVKLYKNSYLGSSEDNVVVKFDLQNHGEEIDELIIEKGQKIQKPTEPVAEGYVFGGWYKESRCQNAWDFDKDVVTEDTTLYAKWVENAALVVTYNVTYNMQGYGQQIESEMVEEGSLLSEPASPTAEDYTFEGWYKDANCQNKWDFESDRVSSNMTLYAKWIPDVSKDVIAEGKIDENYGNIVWSIDKNGKLLVTGRGDYYSVGNGNPTEPPWMKYKSKIKTAKIALSGSKSVYAMFRDCINLTEVDLSDLDTSSVENMYYMFDGCRSLTEVDLSNLKTDNVYTMMAMFQGCRNLKTLDLSNFNTRNLVDMEAMFLGCSNLSKLDVSNFKTGNVYAMGSAFAVCEKLTNLDLSSFDTRNVTRMCAMFSGCSNLRALDLSHFNTDKVEDMCYMFEGCGRLETLDISNFNTANVSEEDGCTDLLSGCISLSYIHAPKNCTYSVKLPTAAATDKWYLEKNTECTELPKNLGYSAKLYKNLYIGSNEDSVTVKFDLQNHGEEIDDLIIEKGQKIQKPTEPVAEGYTFGGWFKELECQTAWDFDKDIVTEDTTLYAKWSYLGDTSAGDIPESGAPEGLWIAGIQDYTYTGKAIKPQIRVYFKEIKLKEGQDYTISYKNNIKAAGMDDKKAPTVTIKGKGNYAGTAVKTFTINKAMLTASNLKAASAYQMGKAYTPIIILNGNVLKNKTDYTLTYKTADGTVLNGQPTKELGSYIMHIKGKGNCGGSFDFHYKITEKGSVSIEKGTATVGEMIYGGKNPSTMLTVDGKTLTTSDYTVVFSNTSAKGTATATFIGIGKYTGVLTKKFKVVAQPIQNTNITIEKNVLYEKGGARPEVSVKTNKTMLTEGVDYTVSYKGNTKLGNTAKAIVKGKGNYSGSISIDFQIKGKPLNDKNMEIFVSDVVAGKKPVVAVYDANGKKLSSGSDYEAKIDQDKQTVTITGGKNGCYTGTVVKTYKELPADKIITSVKLNKNANSFPKNYNAYTGEAVTLKNEWLTVKAKNTVLPSNCFTLSYMNNVKKGTATVIVQGKNGYSGIKTMTFKIKAYDLKNILTWLEPKPDGPKPETYTVKFSANGGSWENTDVKTVTVEVDLTVVLPDEPIRKGYVFIGWKDSDGNAFSEDTPVTKDITVYAQWGMETVSGSFAVTGGMLGIDYRYLDHTLTILTNKPLTIANKDPQISVSDTIMVADKVNADITLAGVNINVKETGSSASPGKAAFQIADDSVGNVTITLKKDTKNVLLSGYGRAGVEKDGDKNSGTLTIAGEGALTVVGGERAAGIGGKDRDEGGHCFHVTITGGEITADGGYYGAGIGSGGGKGNGGSITISGGNITANGGDYGAGIGGGNSENINIQGTAVVSAASGKYGAGIGGSGAGNSYGQASLIQISGSAKVTATGGDYSAGIGGSACNSASHIRIEKNAKVTATGGEKAAGIGGGGYYNPKGLQIDYECNGSDIVICDSAEVTAKGGKGGAGIGGGDYGNGKDITIKDSANVSAFGGEYGAGIGGGGSGSEYDANSNIIGGHGSNIIIDGGVVTAKGGKYGAGIGGGGNDWDIGGTGSGITIRSFAKVTTSGGEYGAGIGGDSGRQGGGKGSNITINGDVIVFVEAGGIGHSGLDTGIVSPESASLIRGVVFNGTEGVVYGSVTLNVDAEIPKNDTLTVPDGAVLDVSHVTFTNNGVITVEAGGTVKGNILGDGILKEEGGSSNSYADPFALPDLTGDRRTDFIAVAMSQVGYTEAMDGSTCFGAWAGDPYCNWCSEFAAWCAEQAGIPKTVIPKGTSSRKYRNFFAEKGRYYYIAEGIDGKNTEFMSGYKNIGTISAEDLIEGDIILKESDGDINNGPDHTAIFLKYEDGIVEYVSGNANDSVMVSHCYIEEFHGVCKPDF